MSILDEINHIQKISKQAPLRKCRCLQAINFISLYLSEFYPKASCVFVCAYIDMKL